METVLGRRLLSGINEQAVLKLFAEYRLGATDGKGEEKDQEIVSRRTGTGD